MNVFRSRFFWRIYASYSAVLIATAAIVFLLVDRNLNASLRADLERTLRNGSILVEPWARSVLAGDEDPDRSEVTEIGEGAGVRLTLITPGGVVVADSHEDPKVTDNHGSRPEVLEAWQSGVGVRERFSKTVGYPMVYVARAVFEDAGGEDRAPLGVVRVALPVSRVEEELSAARNSVILGTAAGLLVALGLGLVVARRSTSPISEITRVAEGMRAGRYAERAHLTSGDEIGTLGDTMNRLGAELEDRIERITREDARLRAMLSGMVEGVVAVDQQDVIAFCNQASRRLLGMEEEGEVVGEALWDVTEVAGLSNLLEAARQSGALAKGELTLGGDHDLVLEVHAAPFAVGESTQGLVIVAHDVTELRRLERVRRDFVANVSHELKTPLTSIKGFVETLLSGALHDEEVNVRFLQRIETNVNRLSHLVTDLLSLARIESASTAQLERVDLGAILQRAAEGFGEKARDQGVGFEVDSTQGLIVLGDAEALDQVVGNLVENAINYTPAPGRVAVRLWREGERAIFEVQDTGVGIPESDLERVFERFYRVDKARSREVGGTGVGLSIVRNQVHAQGGEVRVRSEVGVGSTFRVELPLAG